MDLYVCEGACICKLQNAAARYITGNKTSAVTDKASSSTGRCLQRLEFSMLILHSLSLAEFKSKLGEKYGVTCTQYNYV